MEYEPGGDLAGLMQRLDPFLLPLAAVCSAMEQLLRGLCYLHTREIVHQCARENSLGISLRVSCLSVTLFSLATTLESEPLARLTHSVLASQVSGALLRLIVWH